MVAYKAALAEHTARVCPPKRSRTRSRKREPQSAPGLRPGFRPHNAVGLTYADRLAILWLYRHGADRHATAEAFGISTAMLHRIVRQEASRLDADKPTRKTK
jgi:hypothetical protein